MEANWLPSEELTQTQKSRDFEVEDILDDRKKKGGPRIFKVKWKTDPFPDWVSEKEMHCKELKLKYFQEKKVKKVTQYLIEKNLHEKVIAIKYLEPNQHLFFTVKSSDGKIQEISNEEMKANHLSTLLDFYENNLILTDKEVHPANH